MLSRDILMKAMRPGRYTGQEWNAVKKDHSKVKLTSCLCFPEIYEVGMSNLGVRILYDVLNSQRDLLCERAFCPWPDFQQVLKESSLKLSSLESGIPLRDFDVIGFSVNNELNYTNVLTMLSLSDIPFMSKDRTSGFPLIIGGGNCTLNPEPLADFFDLFIIGEAEEVILDVVKICKKFKHKYGEVCKNKQELLTELCQIPGVYVPQFYRVEYNSDMTVKEFAPLKKEAPAVIRKVHVKDLNRNLQCLNWIVPNIEVIHDRIGIEIMRGCAHRCRFCQARSYFFPLRIRSAKNIFALAKRFYKISGYEQISLLSLSSSDHPQIEKIVKFLIEYFRKNAVSVALPSIRPKYIIGDIPQVISSQKKTGFTFAPEAGTERLRKIINKDINSEELFDAARDAFKSGYRRIKLYFMIGLPTEDYKDLDAIVDLSYKLSQLRRELCGQAAEINLSIGTFIPKPHTPFQWLNMAKIGEIKEKQMYLKRAIYDKKYKFLMMNFSNVNISILEAALARGHRDLSRVIISAFNKGAQFDQWRECFNFENWRQSFSEHGLDIEEFATRPLGLDKKLVWDFIDTGINKQYLRDEFQKALT
ncbi:MAG: TIGR03960 family B12-binding radical SAM protein [Candidatus Omnitrophica bacterium]|nr:TIGR03960 family B12-binding radical SAM protein [Candidatus Omnitrophota bacterium]MDD5352747.1 TIGR03960 family B12-binding radical SAM protein [Candidatus Omnitrophota bacterium]MDD5550346.1 TIGR03960 family B12-binding radical SAM protein [Candidatus Omnitrophota bacterium]